MNPVPVLPRPAFAQVAEIAVGRSAGAVGRPDELDVVGVVDRHAVRRIGERVREVDDDGRGRGGHVVARVGPAVAGGSSKYDCSVPMTVEPFACRCSRAPCS